MTSLLRTRVLGIAGETTEGTFNTPSTATTPGTTASIVIYDPRVTLKPDKYRREPARANLSPLPPIIGIQRGSVTFKAEVKGPEDVSSNLGIPEVDLLLRACGMKRTDTGGGGSAVTARAYTPTSVMKPHWTATLTAGATAGTSATITVASTTGLAVGDVVSFYLSRATLTREEQCTIDGITDATHFTVATLAANKNSGDIVERTNRAIPLSLELQDQEKSYRIHGARGDITKVGGKVGEPGMYEFKFEGGIEAVTDTFTAFSVTQGVKIPPAFFSGAVSLGSGPYTGADYSEISFALGNTLAPRESARTATGLVSTLITGRAPKGTFDPEAVTEATYAYWSKLFAGTAQALSVRFGSTSKNRVTFATPAAVLEELADQDRTGIACNGASFEMCTLTGSGDDEFSITFD